MLNLVGDVEALVDCAESSVKVGFARVSPGDSHACSRFPALPALSLGSYNHCPLCFVEVD